LKILVACEESQAVTIRLRALGHEAYSCDIMECSGGHPEWHLKQDVTEVLKEKWDMIIAFPPCTYLSNAGACRLYPTKGNIDPVRYNKGLKAKEFFLMLLNADCKRIAVENPVSSKVFNMPIHSQEIQPYEYGHPFTKKTRLWLKGLPSLTPTDIVTPTGPYISAGTGRKDKSKYGASRCGGASKARSKTFPGIADAMAQQWSNV
jgi:hypothetical protein